MNRSAALKKEAAKVENYDHGEAEMLAIAEKRAALANLTPE